LRDSENPIVILGRGEIKVPLKVRVHRISAGARTKIEKAGGSVELLTK
jgi:large subunit ribosomal protein L15